MTAAKHGPTGGETTGQQSGLSALARALDVARERERLRLAEARRDKAEAELRAQHARVSQAQAALAQILSSNLSSAQRPRSLPPPSRRRAQTPLELAGHGPAPAGHPWLKTGAVALSVFAVVVALRVPVSKPAPPPPFEPHRAEELGNAPGPNAGAGHDDRACGSPDGTARSHNGVETLPTCPPERGDLAHEPR